MNRQMSRHLHPLECRICSFTAWTWQGMLIHLRSKHPCVTQQASTEPKK